MTFTIEQVDIHDEKIESAIRELIMSSFPSQLFLPPGYIARNIESNASLPGFFLVAKEKGVIIGCNGFLANDFVLNGQHFVGYQSCWTATDPAHRRKGVFQALINEAKKVLKNSGTGFIYGMANNESLPVLTGKLGFTEIPSLVARIPRMPFYRHFFLKKGKVDNTGACTLNDKQVMDHKKIQAPHEILSFSHGDSRIWGKLIRKRKLGINIPVFYVGGIQLQFEQDLPFLVREIFTSTGAMVIQLISCQTNSFNVLIRRWKQTKKINGFIFYNLNMPPFQHFNLMFGAIDVF